MTQSGRQPAASRASQPLHVQPDAALHLGKLRLRIVLDGELGFLVDGKAQPTHQLSDAELDLDQSEAHSDAVTGAIAEREEAVRMSSADGIWGKSIRVETVRVRVDLRVVVDAVDRDHDHGVPFDGGVQAVDTVRVVGQADQVAYRGVLAKGFWGKRDGD